MRVPKEPPPVGNGHHFVGHERTRVLRGWNRVGLELHLRPEDLPSVRQERNVDSTIARAYGARV